jgi:EAL domain-containing protein (putative c-di-GMP-specific phosphodiesterase class I)
VPQSNQTAAILRSTVALARELGIRITGEGIETEQHLSVARLFGLDELQGYLLGRPQPAEAVDISNPSETSAGSPKSSNLAAGWSPA